MCDRKKEKTPEGAFSLKLTESLNIYTWAETYSRWSLCATFVASVYTGQIHSNTPDEWN